MTSSVVNHVISAVASAIDTSTDSITVDSTKEELGIDSLEVVELVMELEDDFDIEVSDAEIESCNTVQDVINLVNDILKKQTRTEIGLQYVYEPNQNDLVKGINIHQVPLHLSEDRCLGHEAGSIKELCELRYQCARHMTIMHPNEPWADAKPPMYVACPTDKKEYFIKVLK